MESENKSIYVDIEPDLTIMLINTHSYMCTWLNRHMIAVLPMYTTSCRKFNPDLRQYASSGLASRDILCSEGTR